ncbi:hypothetical protein THICB3320744 [Thiomonas sp. CB3]|nr:hypothetical protein THICB3320744 [Thiomonas sp. CB3]
MIPDMTPDRSNEILQRFLPVPERDPKSYLRNPFRMGDDDFVCATNRHMIVAIPLTVALMRGVYFDDIDASEPKEFMRAVSKILSASINAPSNPDLWRDLPDLPALSPCPACRGSGVRHVVPCSLCAGTGQDVHRTYVCDCTKCSGSGEIYAEAGGEQHVCWDCNGMKVDLGDSVVIADARFCLAYLHILRDIGAKLHITGRDTASFFRTDDLAYGAIMPMRY